MSVRHDRSYPTLGRAFLDRLYKDDNITATAWNNLGSGFLLVCIKVKSLMMSQLNSLFGSLDEPNS